MYKEIHGKGWHEIRCDAFVIRMGDAGWLEFEKAFIERVKEKYGDINK